MHYRSIFAAAALAALSTQAQAAAPAGALNKTINLSYSAIGTATPIGGQPRSFSTLINLTIYVSSTGRVFRKSSARSTGHRRTQGKDYSFAPGEGSAFTFKGDRMVGVVPFATGARQITINFDPGFSSCTANIIEGHSAGGTIRRRAPNGETVDVTNGTTTTPSCSVQSGNGFAQ